MNEQIYYKANQRQVGFWNDQKKNNAYGKVSFSQGSIRLENIEINALKKAYQALFRRHESFRTIFVNTSSGLKCIIKNFHIVDNEFLVFENSINQSSIDKEVKKAISSLSCMDNAPLARGVLQYTSDNNAIFNFFLANIIADGWSMKLFKEELLFFYQEYKKDITFKVDILKYQLKDYSDYLNKKKSLRITESIRCKLKQTKINTELFQLNDFDDISEEKITQLLRNRNGNYIIKHLTKINLDFIVNNLTTSVFSIFLTGLRVLFYKLFKIEEILVLSIFSNRFNNERKLVIGNLTGEVYIWDKINKDKKISELIQQSYFSFLKSALKVQYNSEELCYNYFRSKIHIYFNYMDKNFTLNKKLDSDNNKFGFVESTYYLAVYVEDFEDGYRVIWKYNNELLSKGVVEMLAYNYNQILKNMESNLDYKTKDI